MADAPTRDEIIAQLDSILASPDFTAGPRVQKFLSHLVNEELAGRGDRLKGTALAMDVFGRGADFDSNNDPVVRIEAVKLRKAIEHYYLTSGREDEIVISVPKGKYRPGFQRRTLAPTAASPPRRTGLPTLGLVPFTGATSEHAMLYREGLPEEIALELGRFDQVRVVSAWHDPDGSGGAALTGRADYILRGIVREAGGTLRIAVQMNRLPDETLVWSDRFLVGADHSDPFTVQEDIARQCATRMADAYGAVAADLGAQYSGRRATDAGVFEALLAFHAHMRTNRVASLREFRELAEDAVRDNPASGLAHALLAIALIEAVTVGDARVADVLADGQRHAEQAIALAPNCQEALFAAAAISDALGDGNRYETLIDRAIEANPNGTLLTALAGGWIMKLGQTARGRALLETARQRNPLLPVWTEIPLVIEPLIEGRYEEAAELVRSCDARDSIYDWILIATAKALAGQTDGARKALDICDRAGIDPLEYMREVPMHPVLIERISEGLRLARG